MILQIEHDTGATGWLRLTEGFWIDLPNTGRQWIRPTIWDGNSTPKLPFSQYFVPQWRFLLASLVHDQGCRDSKSASERAKWDKDYRWIILTYYRQTFRSWIGYAGVSLGTLNAKVRGKFT